MGFQREMQSSLNRAPEKLGVAVIFWRKGAIAGKSDGFIESDEIELRGGLRRDV